MKKSGRFFLYVILLLVIIYLLGSKPEEAKLTKDLPSISSGITNIESYVKKNDAGMNIKPDNESRVIWANDSIKTRTDYCLLYLHGFSASWYEGYPSNVEFAKHFGMNAYFPRLASHGLVTEDPLIDMKPGNLWDSAKDALMIAKSLGKKVIIMSTSTGGTLGLKLAADFPEYVYALILYSPNIRINNKAAFLLSKPWGLQIGRKVNGGLYRVTNEDFDSKDCQYWYCKYRMEGTIYLQQLVDLTMKKEIYTNVTCPVFLGYYFKDEANQDQTVKVGAMLKMFDQLGTENSKKVKMAFPEAADHVIACELTSGSYKEVSSETIRFGEQILELSSIE